MVYVSPGRHSNVAIIVVDTLQAQASNGSSSPLASRHIPRIIG